MSNIGNYSAMGNAAPASYSNFNTAQKVQSFAQYLHDFLPVLEAEFDALEERSKIHPNDVFPIKMAALSSIYQAAQPLYEWYVEKAKK